MLEVSRRFAIACDYAPLVGQQPHLPIAHSYHRLDCNAHAVFEQRTVAFVTVVGHGRVFVHLAADTMTGNLPDNSIAVLLAVGLYRVGDVTDVIACYSLLNA